MTDGWDERTEAMPGTKGDKSFELDFELDFRADPRSADDPDVTSKNLRASLVVFEPTALGLADGLQAMGYAVRVGSTGVDVMSIVANRPPAAVICAPAPDAERRRLLAAALRLRFPAVPVLYVSTHANQEEAVLGAIREGARAVIAWPLPPAIDLARVLQPYVAAAIDRSTDDENVVTPAQPLTRRALDADARLPGEAPRPPTTGHGGEDGPTSLERMRSGKLPAPAIKPPTSRAPLPLAPSADSSAEKTRADDESLDSVAPSEFDDVATLVTEAPAAPAPAPRPAMPPRPRLVSEVKPVPLPVPASSATAFERSFEEPITAPNLAPAPVAALEAASERRGEIGQLLAAISPFLWSLEDAARWAEELGKAGDVSATNHARTLKLLAKILAQLQARIDETGA